MDRFQSLPSRICTQRDTHLSLLPERRVNFAVLQVALNEVFIAYSAKTVSGNHRLYHAGVLTGGSDDENVLMCGKRVAVSVWSFAGFMYTKFIIVFRQYIPAHATGMMPIWALPLWISAGLVVRSAVDCLRCCMSL